MRVHYTGARKHTHTHTQTHTHTHQSFCVFEVPEIHKFHEQGHLCINRSNISHRKSKWNSSHSLGFVVDKLLAQQIMVLTPLVFPCHNIPTSAAHLMSFICQRSIIQFWQLTISKLLTLRIKEFKNRSQAQKPAIWTKTFFIYSFSPFL